MIRFSFRSVQSTYNNLSKCPSAEICPHIIYVRKQDTIALTCNQAFFLKYREAGYDRRLKGGAEKLPRHCTRAYTTYIPRLLRTNSMQGTPG